MIASTPIPSPPPAPPDILSPSYLRVSFGFAERRIGKAVQLRHVPNAVRRMGDAQATGATREGALLA